MPTTDCLPISPASPSCLSEFDQLFEPVAAIWNDGFGSGIEGDPIYP